MLENLFNGLNPVCELDFTPSESLCVFASWNRRQCLCQSLLPLFPPSQRFGSEVRWSSHPLRRTEQSSGYSLPRSDHNSRALQARPYLSSLRAHPRCQAAAWGGRERAGCWERPGPLPRLGEQSPDEGAWRGAGLLGGGSNMRERSGRPMGRRAVTKGRLSRASSGSISP